MNEWISDEDVCRTALDTQGLLLTLKIIVFNRPDGGGAVLQTALSIINSLNKLFLQNPKYFQV